MSVPVSVSVSVCLRVWVRLLVLWCVVVCCRWFALAYVGARVQGCLGS